MEKIKITNKCQFEKLVEELEKNPALARGFHRGTVPNNFKEQWNSIATVLNSLGPPIRTGDGWQKIWRDLKFKVKKKMTKNKAEAKATGGGVFKQAMLSPLEEAVANLLQFEKQANPKGMVQGVPSVRSPRSPEDSVDMHFMESLILETQPTISVEASAPTTSVPSTLAPSTAPLPSTTKTTAPLPLTTKINKLKRKFSSAPKKDETPVKRNELLERHSSDQARILTEISNSVASLKRSLREIKDIQAKKLKLEVERSKREEEKHIADMKIKKIEFQINERQLELLNSN